MSSAKVVSTLYETDFVEWVNQTAQLLREHRFDAVDLENLVEEVEDLSRRERDALYSNLKVILIHLLKWQFQSERHTSSWRASIVEHRQRLQRQLKNAPSLKPYLEETFLECYEDARSLAVAETGLDLAVFPQECPYTVRETLAQDFWPIS
ncbi:hypothetical protein AVDCRST_MAG81-1475 [uncultured Synechococcales cyanobacterium]|uniref:DUF29 domain-containing protein n=1 Tax=uncultured Synechococcales cyanobacterium TaxID=1936017 RepID=A0A6J4V6D5_9CYAN|nr:hypothetical protein AVDCRST_MAG81-1475 [uncultured Synechococcales cyanobacterium]